MTKRAKVVSLLGILGGLAVASTARAEVIPYQNIGTYNSTSYAFVATSSGDLTGYFVGGFGASYRNAIGVLVNGVQLGGFALGNHSSPVGQSHTYGYVNAGDSIVFVMRSYTLGLDAYSDPRMNTLYDHSDDSTDHNHIYSTTYDMALLGMPEMSTGIYVGFEDLRSPRSDYNYNDESAVFTNISYQLSQPISSAVPEPSTWAMVLIGFAGLSFAASRKQTSGRAALSAA